MIRAILMTGLIGITCAFLSCFITLKGWSLMGDALSHSVVPGVALAYYLKFPFSIGAFLTGLLAALSMSLIKVKSKLKEDAIIGIVFTTFLAIGIFLLSIFPSQIQIQTIVLGNVLSISDMDIQQVLIISSITFCFFLFQWKNLLVFCFDPIFARTVGLNTIFLHVLLLALLSATAVAALKAVGACLVVAMLITPGATAYLLTKQFSKMLFISTTLGFFSSVFGAYFSFFFDGATGGCIVLLQSCFFIIALYYSSHKNKKSQKIILENSNISSESLGPTL